MPLWSSNPNSDESDNDEDSNLNTLLTVYKPLLSKLTFSSFMGYCSAFTAKKIGKGMMFIAGLGFMTLQGLAYTGWVDVNWKEVEKSVVNKIDADNDGAITEKDLRLYWKKATRILTQNIPDASGFGVGFMLGLRA
mmetsp:Transcript_8509/g.15380  ORF Transcript_8509/g.15380 Transcript_8509/m.15380 type:complete len:136 (-) Transcript_8509:346-753(-)|eukprot:CAMPEP_0201610266 /NCGR_PEP_ID=MMETSP0492-20130828/16367_1 /ASSEMBLY_ACC=CAM_ASM_000837 /TAXON_ID=420259 /ORGANISM="Thalassiosira gravida, Strain GMp14c1" /LENGTH=135 /DNA_ID=CAMNT_0048076041 /DNA_START=73 /DNA_END=480 /DNA_ORIENTATION=+